MCVTGWLHLTIVVKCKETQFIGQALQDMWANGEAFASIAEVKQEVTLAQERKAQDFSYMLTKSTYQFQKKGNEMQYSINMGVKESIVSAKKQLEK